MAHFFRVLRDPDTRARLIKSLVLTPYARTEFELTWEPAKARISAGRGTALRTEVVWINSAYSARSSRKKLN